MSPCDMKTGTHTQVPLTTSLFPVFDGQSLYALKVFEVRGDKCHLMVDGCSTDEQIKLIDPLACVFQ